jgi:hypothetical protein
MKDLTKKAGRLLMGAGWLLYFSAAVYGTEWPLKKVKLEKKHGVAASEFKSGISQQNLLNVEFVPSQSDFAPVRSGFHGGGS